MLKKILKVAGIILAVLLMGAVAVYFYLRPAAPRISAEDRAAINLMPLPASLKLGSEKLWIDSDFKIDIKGPADELVQRAIQRLRDRTTATLQREFKYQDVAVLLTYDSTTLPVQPVRTNESYSLSIRKNGVHLKSPSAYGILRGLETITQLLTESEGKFYLPEVEIKDAPRYLWRGLMIDVCRHWIPKDVILRNLEAMAAVKMNVFHWHLSEYQAFRVESKKFPKLHELGSTGNFYTQEDIREIVAFARERGIRVVPEFDMPGHTTSFFVGYPELASAPGPYKLETNFGVLRPVMDPTREEVYQFIDAFVGEMSTLFPDPYFHIGGDEVNFADWESNASIQAFMKSHEIATTHALQSYFNKRVQEILTRHGKRMIGWDEILNPALGNDIVVQSWRNQKSLFEAVQKGNKAILSAGYYLDHKLPASKHYQTDPEILPGAITIQPDSLHWQQYDITIDVSDAPIKTNLVLYGTSPSVRGLFYLAENVTAFEHAQLENNQLQFSFQSDFGEIDLASEFRGDSLLGKMALGLLSFNFKGIKTGGNDWPGTQPPSVEQMRPLTAEEKKNILGGEAAMWSEVVSMDNIDSRIWPRAAAIAEKWWSDPSLTKDVPDMYRRLDALSVALDQRGIQHVKGQEKLINDLAQGKETQSLKNLISVLEEVKYYERLSLGVTTATPLNEVVDAVLPESRLARQFSGMVDAFLADSTHQQHELEIRKYLKIWRSNHENFLLVARGNPRLEKVILTSEELSTLAHFALLSLDALQGRQKLSPADKEAMLKKTTSTSRAGVLLAVAPALAKLVEAIPVN